MNLQTPVAQIVLEHSECAPVLQRHRIDYCCKGHLPLEEAAAERGADVQALVAELESAIAGRSGRAGYDPRALTTPELIEQITSRHHAYLREALPFLVPLATKVARVHGAHNQELLDLRDVVAELSDALLPHLEREEQVLFPPLLRGEGGAAAVQDELKTMVGDHLEVGALLERMRSATSDFSLPQWACASYTTLFRELEALEGDILRHVHLENHVLMPRFAAA